MTRIRMYGGLPMVSLHLRHQGKTLVLEHALVDTGSAGTLLLIDHALTIGLGYLPQDILYRVPGIGGYETVFEKTIDSLAIDNLLAVDFLIQIGAMDYDFALDAIIGMDFLTRIGACIDLAKLSIEGGQ